MNSSCGCSALAPPTSGPGESAAQFRFDPHREPDRQPGGEGLLRLCPSDVVVDVGGGAGRVSLPLALRCREVVTVEPSAGMAAEYEGSKTARPE